MYRRARRTQPPPRTRYALDSGAVQPTFLRCPLRSALLSVHHTPRTALHPVWAALPAPAPAPALPAPTPAPAPPQRTLPQRALPLEAPPRRQAPPTAAPVVEAVILLWSRIPMPSTPLSRLFASAVESPQSRTLPLRQIRKTQPSAHRTIPVDLTRTMLPVRVPQHASESSWINSHVPIARLAPCSDWSLPLGVETRPYCRTIFAPHDSGVELSRRRYSSCRRISPTRHESSPLFTTHIKSSCSTTQLPSNSSRSTNGWSKTGNETTLKHQ
mmetsp:Transcript_49481/g.124400  ORF Transcript_49481/g.124400 Transcript_49481/m.124400 type:complete len:271 (-) Transcript_49481:51-863(-)